MNISNLEHILYHYFSRINLIIQIFQIILLNGVLAIEIVTGEFMDKDICGIPYTYMLMVLAFTNILSLLFMIAYQTEPGNAIYLTYVLFLIIDILQYLGYMISYIYFLVKYGGDHCFVEDPIGILYLLIHFLTYLYYFQILFGCAIYQCCGSDRPLLSQSSHTSSYYSYVDTIPSDLAVKEHNLPQNEGVEYNESYSDTITNEPSSFISCNGGESDKTSTTTSLEKD